MLATANGRWVYIERSPFGVPSLAATRLRTAIVDHSDVILRVALLCGSFVGYALSGLVA